ncbi:MAG: hypothetical protein JNK90_23315 [Planctomycetaceae bacterium]|nr:hypothetical protein [Planctomycetaceae bacterium]
MLHEISKSCLGFGSGSRFLQDAASKICTPSSLILVHPTTASVELVMQFLFEELDRRRWRIQELDVLDLDIDKIPESLCSRLNIDYEAGDGRSLENISRKIKGLDSIHLTNLSKLDSRGKQNWIAFLNRWTILLKQSVDSNRRAPSFVTSANLDDQLQRQVHQDTVMTMIWWWGIPSSLELQLLCREHQNDLRDIFETRWRESLGAAVASGDLEFLGAIWDKLTDSMDTLAGTMLRYAEGRKWTTSKISQLLDGLLPQYYRRAMLPTWRENEESLSVSPPQNLRAAWMEGLVFYSPEYGCELHAAAACQLDAKFAKSRIWRAQLSLILPQLDIARSMICEALTSRLGNSWPTKFRPPKDDQECIEVTHDPMSCQLGHLDLLLQNYRELQRVNHHFRVLAKKAKDLRNDLSHLRPISYEQYRSFHETARLAFN